MQRANPKHSTLRAAGYLALSLVLGLACFVVPTSIAGAHGERVSDAARAKAQQAAPGEMIDVILVHNHSARANLTGHVRALKGESLVLYGDGNQTRSFCYVDDLMEGLISLMDSDPEITGPINLGNPIEVTMRELAETVLELTGSKSDVLHEELPSDDPVRRCPDISLAARTLSWEPKVDLREGLTKTIAYFDDLFGLAGRD